MTHSARNRPVGSTYGLGTLIAVLAFGATTVAQGSLAPSAAWNAFSTDMTLRRAVVGVDGKPVGAAIPTMRYRLERTETADGWRTVTTVLSAEPFKVLEDGKVTLLDHFAVARIEDDGDGSPSRIYLRNGKLLDPRPAEAVATGIRQLFELNPEAADQIVNNRSQSSQLRGRDWVEAFISSQSPTLRRASIENRFGRPVARERGFDRYVRREGDSQVDVLLEATSGLLSAVDTSKNGALVGHTTLSWVVGPGNSFVRSALHSEGAIEGRQRFVTDVEYSNVMLQFRRAR